MFKKIDDYILHQIYQPLVDYVFDRWNRNLFWLMKWTNVLLFATLTVFDQYFGWVNVIITVFFGIYMLWLMRTLDEIEKHTNSILEQGGQLPPRLVTIIPRLFFVFLGILYCLSSIFDPDLPHAINGYIVWVLIISSQYLMACDHKPRKPFKKQQEVKKFVPNPI